MTVIGRVQEAITVLVDDMDPFNRSVSIFLVQRELQILYLLFSYHERLYKGIYLEGANELQHY